MFSSVVLSVFCLAAVAIGQDDSAQFYGYGTGIRGLPLFYADGRLLTCDERLENVADQVAGTAYLGNVSLSDASLAINVTRKQGCPPPAISLILLRTRCLYMDPKFQ